MSTTGWAVRVNECLVLATEKGADWWVWFRWAMEPIGRITVVTASIGGDLVDVACDDRDNADWLAATAVDHGVPKSAVKVVRTGRVTT